MRPALTLVEDLDDSPSSGAAEPSPILTDGSLLDAYSRAVVSAADRISPAVGKIDVRRNATHHRSESGGPGSGFLVPPGRLILTHRHGGSVPSERGVRLP